MDHLWVIARVELRLTDEEFLDLSYRQFSLLHQRTLLLRWQEQWQQGAIWAAIHNNGFRSYKKPPKPDDLVFTIVPGQMPSAKPKRNRISHQKNTQIADFFRALKGPACPAESTSTSTQQS